MFLSSRADLSRSHDGTATRRLARSMPVETMALPVASRAQHAGRPTPRRRSKISGREQLHGLHKDESSVTAMAPAVLRVLLNAPANNNTKALGLFFLWVLPQRSAGAYEFILFSHPRLGTLRRERAREATPSDGQIGDDSCRAWATSWSTYWCASRSSQRLVHSI